MTTELRMLRRSEWDVWYDGILRAFGAVERTARDLYRELTEIDRSVAVWDGDQAVGSASLISFRMTVPGGAVVPAAGLSMVHVAATHRRQGILRSMMRRQLDDIRAAGVEPLAVLTASEPRIYGRFGYGMASRALYADIDTTRVSIDVPPESDRIRMRFVSDAGSVRDVCEAVYARRVTARPGMLERAPGWERLPLLDPPEERDGATPLACVLAEDEDGEVLGYARYALKSDWDEHGVTQGRVLLRDLEALNTASYGALWRYLFNIDLMPTLVVSKRPVDDPWLHMIGDDVRLCRPRWRDALFLRPVEVGAALEARTYSDPIDVVIDVADDFCPWNAGRWRLSGDGKGATCERTGEAVDLALSVRELGAAYLGGTTLRVLAEAGRVRELREGALGAASRAFGTDTPPWLPHTF
jgi:predicted acetyltransferase